MSPLELCAAAALLVTFAVAVVGKVRSADAFREFAAATGQFGVPRSARTAAAAAVVAAELAVVVTLLLPFDRPLARLGPAVALLGVLSVAVAAAARGGRRVDCHCFGVGGPTATRPHLAVNTALVVLGLAGVVAPGTPADGGTTVLAVGFGVIAGVVAVTAVPVLEAIGPAGMRPVPARRGPVPARKEG